jgi:hypothetical protein
MKMHNTVDYADTLSYHFSTGTSGTYCFLLLLFADFNLLSFDDTGFNSGALIFVPDHTGQKVVGFFSRVRVEIRKVICHKTETFNTL